MIASSTICNALIIPGKIISEMILTKEERLDVFKKAGAYLKSFHKTTAEGFGEITSEVHF